MTTSRQEERLREVKEKSEREYGVRVVYYVGGETAINAVRLPRVQCLELTIDRMTGRLVNES